MRNSDFKGNDATNAYYNAFYLICHWDVERKSNCIEINECAQIELRFAISVHLVHRLLPC